MGRGMVADGTDFLKFLLNSGHFTATHSLQKYRSVQDDNLTACGDQGMRMDAVSFDHLQLMF